MNPLIALPLHSIASAEDVERGWKEVSLLLKDGTSATIRLSAIPEAFVGRVLQRYAISEDPRDLLRPMLPAEHATDEFLKTITPGGLAALCNTAVALAVGLERFQDLLLHGKQTIGKPLFHARE